MERVRTNYMLDIHSKWQSKVQRRIRIARNIPSDKPIGLTILSP